CTVACSGSRAANRKRPRAASARRAVSALRTASSSVDLSKLPNSTKRSKPPAKKKKLANGEGRIQRVQHGMPHVVLEEQTVLAVREHEQCYLPPPCSPLTDAASFFDCSSPTESAVESQPLLQLDDLSEHVFSLDVRHSDAAPLQMNIGLEDVVSIMDDTDHTGLFSACGGGSCGAFAGLETRFGPLDLDNLPGFGMNTKGEGF
ncbi:unnamed protein product, partial [Agarophyton chilense]